MSDASKTAHRLLLEHAASPDRGLNLPVDPTIVGRALSIPLEPVSDAYDRWDKAVALGRALKPADADPDWVGDFAFALLMPAEIIRVMFANGESVAAMSRDFDVPWYSVRRRLARLGLDGYAEGQSYRDA